MTVLSLLRKNTKNDKIPNPSLTGATRVFSPQPRRKLEFFPFSAYNVYSSFCIVMYS